MCRFLFLPGFFIAEKDSGDLYQNDKERSRNSICFSLCCSVSEQRDSKRRGKWNQRTRPGKPVTSTEWLITGCPIYTLSYIPIESQPHGPYLSAGNLGTASAPISVTRLWRIWTIINGLAAAVSDNNHTVVTRPLHFLGRGATWRMRGSVLQLLQRVGQRVLEEDDELVTVPRSAECECGSGLMGGRRV